MPVLVPGSHIAHVRGFTVSIPNEPCTIVLQIANVGPGNTPTGTPGYTSSGISFTSTGSPQNQDFANIPITASMNGMGVFAYVYDRGVLLYTLYAALPNGSPDLIGVPGGSGGIISWD
jgi:hypothetical protein